MGYKKVDVNGTQLKCPVCGCDDFEHKRVLLNTVRMTLLKLDWAN